MAEGRVLVACSGGADSVALLLGLSRLQVELKCELHVAHINHQLRGAESDEDASFVTGLAQELALSCSAVSISLNGDDADHGRSIEDAARQARYAALRNLAERHSSQLIATGHTADDQAETVLHHIARGTSIRGLAGIPARRELTAGLAVVRPLLEITRGRILEFLAVMGKNWRDDSSNDALHYTRNRIRHRVIPLLKTEINPQVVRSLTSLARQAREISDGLTVMAERVLKECCLQNTGDLVRINCQSLAELPPFLVREVFVVLWRHNVWPMREMGFEEWDRLAKLAVSGGTTDLPSEIRAVCSGTLMTLSYQNHQFPQSFSEAT